MLVAGVDDDLVIVADVFMAAEDDEVRAERR
jgi:hypothetical protein